MQHNTYLYIILCFLTTPIHTLFCVSSQHIFVFCVSSQHIILCSTTATLRPASGHVVDRGGGLHDAVRVPTLPRRELFPSGAYI